VQKRRREARVLRDTPMKSCQRCTIRSDNADKFTPNAVNPITTISGPITHALGHFRRLNTSAHKLVSNISSARSLPRTGRRPHRGACPSLPYH